MGIERIRVAVKNDDIVLRDPVTTERLTTKGKTVPKNAFWMRRLKAGDCVLMAETKTKTPSVTKAENKPIVKEGAEK
jgi:hypothetical protein